jgi:hypothetical protein
VPLLVLGTPSASATSTSNIKVREPYVPLDVSSTGYIGFCYAAAVAIS